MKVLKKIPGAIGAIQRHTKLLLPRVTIRRLANLAVVGVEMLFRRSRPTSRPMVAKIEASSACNLMCRGCRTGIPLVEYQPGNLSLEDFEVMLDKMGRYLFEVVFYIWGEPLLNKNLPELIKAAHRHNISVIISTNLHFLTEEMGERLLDAGLDKVIFCLDGWSQETYEQVRINGDFELARSNIMRFIEQRRRRGTKKPYLEWQWVVTQNNRPELDRGKTAARELGIEKFVELVDWGNLLPEDERFFEGLKKVRQKQFSRTNRCFWLWSSIAIQYDGNVFPCCHVANKPYSERIYGNIVKDDLATIWNGRQYQHARQLVRSGWVDEETDVVCGQCYSPPIFIERPRS